MWNRIAKIVELSKNIKRNTKTEIFDRVNKTRWMYIAQINR